MHSYEMPPRIGTLSWRWSTELANKVWQNSPKGEKRERERNHRLIQSSSWKGPHRTSGPTPSPKQEQPKAFLTNIHPAS